MLESQMLELHRRKLKNQLRLAAFVLKSNLLDFVEDERLHFDRVEAESL